MQTYATDYSKGLVRLKSLGETTCRGRILWVSVLLQHSVDGVGTVKILEVLDA